MTWLTILAILVCVWAVRRVHNRLLIRVNAMLAAFESAKSLIQRKCRLLPQLAALVQRHLRHHRALLRELEDLAASILSEETADNDRTKAENRIGAILDEVLPEVAQIPALLEDAEFQRLRGSIEELGAKLEVAKKGFDAAASEYNAIRERRPYRWIARTMKLPERHLFAERARATAAA